MFPRVAKTPGEVVLDLKGVAGRRPTEAGRSSGPSRRSPGDRRARRRGEDGVVEGDLRARRGPIRSGGRQGDRRREVGEASPENPAGARISERGSQGGGARADTVDRGQRHLLRAWPSGAVGLARPPGPSRRGRAVDGGGPRQGGRAGADGRAALGREPAEGGAGAVALPGGRRPAPRRADAGDRRGLEGRRSTG